MNKNIKSEVATAGNVGAATQRGQAEAMSAEQEDNTRLRKAQEFLAYSRERENEARKSLLDAVAQTKRAKEKYEELFNECERRATLRRKSGQIECVAGY